MTSRRSQRVAHAAEPPIVAVSAAHSAHDAADRSLGLFPSQREAAAAIMRGAS